MDLDDYPCGDSLSYTVSLWAITGRASVPRVSWNRNQTPFPFSAIFLCLSFWQVPFLLNLHTYIYCFLWTWTKSTSKGYCLWAGDIQTWVTESKDLCLPCPMTGRKQRPLRLDPLCATPGNLYDWGLSIHRYVALEFATYVFHPGGLGFNPCVTYFKALFLTYEGVNINAYP